MFSYIVTLISFCLDLFFSKYIPVFNNNSSFFIPMFTIASLILGLPFFNNDKTKYLKYTLIFGFIYDIAITNTFPLNTALFILIGYVILFIDENISNNVISNIIKLIVIITIYDTITYFILLLIGYIDYNIYILLIKILKSLALNILYIFIFYYLVNYISKKYKIKRVKF